ncbi:MAG: hypothetical protein II826_10800 [Prevotella sp.]|nr:hypothetical protein [Prevotella sp.]
MKKLLTMAIMLIACMSISAHRTGIYLFFDNVDKHVYEDENVRVFFYPSDDGKICILVHNKSKKVIYVDNGSSFIYTNEKPASLYRARATTQGTMSSSGVAVNLGGLAYGMGTRGPVTTALSAITVSSSSGNYRGTIVSEKRIIPVAPLSTEAVFVEDNTIIKTLEAIRCVKNYGEENKNLIKCFWTHRRYVERGQEIKMKKGLSRQYTEENTILSYKALVHYSFTEKMEADKEIEIDNYLKAWVVDRRSGVNHYENARLPYCDEYRNATDNYALFQAQRDGTAYSSADFMGTIFGLLGIMGLALIL